MSSNGFLNDLSPLARPFLEVHGQFRSGLGFMVQGTLTTKFMARISPLIATHDPSRLGLRAYGLGLRV